MPRDKAKNNAYQKAYYRSHPKVQQDKKRRALERRKRILVWFYATFADILKCKCGENHPACMDFHHRDPSTKTASVSNLVRCGSSKARIKAEIAKCDVMCANCHRKFHAVEVFTDTRQSSKLE